MLGLLPNVITALRIALLPAFGWSVVADRTTLAPTLLVLIASSDWLDGFLARRYRLESRLGAVLDPVADKLTQIVGLVLFTAGAHPAFTLIPGFFLALVLAREMMLVYGAVRVRLRRGTLHVRPRFEGKASTCAIFLLLLAASVGAPRPVVWALCLLGSPFVVVSGVRYVIDGHRQMLAAGGSPKGGGAGEATAGGT